MQRSRVSVDGHQLRSLPGNLRQRPGRGVRPCSGPMLLLPPIQTSLLILNGPLCEGGRGGWVHAKLRSSPLCSTLRDNGEVGALGRLQPPQRAARGRCGSARSAQRRPPYPDTQRPEELVLMQALSSNCRQTCAECFES